jgi:large subunit ribosomal protein L25
VQLVLVGEEPKLVGTGEAMVFQALNSVEIECLPTDIMQSIALDMSGLVEPNDALFVRDLVVPEGIEILTSGDEMIARLQPIYEEEEEEEELELEEGEVSPEVEVIQREREEEIED